MAIGKALLATALSCSVAIAGAGLAHPQSEESKAEVAAREKATNQALLKALLQRRAEVARSAGSAERRRDTLQFLDSRIAQLRSRMGG